MRLYYDIIIVIFCVTSFKAMVSAKCIDIFFEPFFKENIWNAGTTIASLQNTITKDDTFIVFQLKLLRDSGK